MDKTFNKLGRKITKYSLLFLVEGIFDSRPKSYLTFFNIFRVGYLESLIVLQLDSIDRAKESHVYSYTNGFKGFAAKLTKKQASVLAGNQDT